MKGGLSYSNYSRESDREQLNSSTSMQDITNIPTDLLKKTQTRNKPALENRHYRLDLSNSNLKDLPNVDENKVAKELNISSESLASVGDLPSVITHLNLRNNKISFVHKLDHVASHLEYLNLSHNRVISLEGIERCHQLKELNLSHNYISDEQIERIAGLHMLEVLDVSHNHLKEEIAISYLERIEWLKALFCNVNDFTMLVLTRASHHLEELSFEENKLQTIIFKKPKSRLLALNLRNNCIVEFRGIEHLGKLQTLRIDNNRLKSLESIKLASNLKNLFAGQNLLDAIEFADDNAIEYLDLSGNRLHDTQFLAPCRQLKKLYLSSNRLVVPIRLRTTFMNLETLHLSRNKLKEITGLDRMPNLVELDLSFNELQSLSGTVRELAKLYKIEVLDLRANRFNQHLHLDNRNRLQLESIESMRQIRSAEDIGELLRYRSIFIKSLAPSLNILDQIIIADYEKTLSPTTTQTLFEPITTLSSEILKPSLLNYYLTSSGGSKQNISETDSKVFKGNVTAFQTEGIDSDKNSKGTQEAWRNLLSQNVIVDSATDESDAIKNFHREAPRLGRKQSNSMAHKISLMTSENTDSDSIQLSKKSKFDSSEDEINFKLHRKLGEVAERPYHEEQDLSGRKSNSKHGTPQPKAQKKVTRLSHRFDSPEANDTQGETSTQSRVLQEKENKFSKNQENRNPERESKIPRAESRTHSAAFYQPMENTDVSIINEITSELDQYYKTNIDRLKKRHNSSRSKSKTNDCSILIKDDSTFIATDDPYRRKKNHTRNSSLPRKDSFPNDSSFNDSIGSIKYRAEYCHYLSPSKNKQLPPSSQLPLNPNPHERARSSNDRNQQQASRRSSQPSDTILQRTSYMDCSIDEKVLEKLGNDQKMLSNPYYQMFKEFINERNRQLNESIIHNSRDSSSGTREAKTAEETNIYKAQPKPNPTDGTSTLRKSLVNTQQNLNSTLDRPAQIKQKEGADLIQDLRVSSIAVQTSLQSERKQSARKGPQISTPPQKGLSNRNNTEEDKQNVHQRESKDVSKEEESLRNSKGKFKEYLPADLKLLASETEDRPSQYKKRPNNKSRYETKESNSFDYANTEKHDVEEEKQFEVQKSLGTYNTGKFESPSLERASNEKSQSKGFLETLEAGTNKKEVASEPDMQIGALDILYKSFQNYGGKSHGFIYSHHLITILKELLAFFKVEVKAEAYDELLNEIKDYIPAKITEQTYLDVFQIPMMTEFLSRHNVLINFQTARFTGFFSSGSRIFQKTREHLSASNHHIEQQSFMNQSDSQFELSNLKIATHGASLHEQSFQFLGTNTKEHRLERPFNCSFPSASPARDQDRARKLEGTRRKRMMGSDLSGGRHSEASENKKSRFMHSLSTELATESNFEAGNEIHFNDIYHPKASSLLEALYQYAVTPPRPIFCKESTQNLLKNLVPSTTEFQILSKILKSSSLTLRRLLKVYSYSQMKRLETVIEDQALIYHETPKASPNHSAHKRSQSSASIALQGKKGDVPSNVIGMTAQNSIQFNKKLLLFHAAKISLLGNLVEDPKGFKDVYKDRPGDLIFSSNPNHCKRIFKRFWKRLHKKGSAKQREAASSLERNIDIKNPKWRVLVCFVHLAKCFIERFLSFKEFAYKGEVRVLELLKEGHNSIYFQKDDLYLVLTAEQCVPIYLAEYEFQLEEYLS